MLCFIRTIIRYICCKDVTIESINNDEILIDVNIEESNDVKSNTSNKKTKKNDKRMLLCEILFPKINNDVSLYLFFFAALFDVEGNVLLVKALSLYIFFIYNE